MIRIGRSLAAAVLSIVIVACASSSAFARENRPHQIEFGLGMMVAGVVTGGGFSTSGGVLPPSTLWFDIPITYRYRVNDHFAAGGGAIISLNKTSSGFLGGGQLVGTIRAYMVPDWLFFDFSLMVGYPFLYGFYPGLGLSIPLGQSASLVLNNQFKMTYMGAFVGLYQPMLGIEIFF